MRCTNGRRSTAKRDWRAYVQPGSEQSYLRKSPVQIFRGDKMTVDPVSFLAGVGLGIVFYRCIVQYQKEKQEEKTVEG